eukprot:TRINITY_DN2106_c0_g2_i1.p1 TRINITY_DN2106_c0_g2~~TRINITY_DN2106_c0_g2_i1.p1  ORF type:complete len:219 (+),score=44.16 TRINITY_DN2106_c0_g2_i1:93-659(+)
MLAATLLAATLAANATEVARSSGACAVRLAPCGADRTQQEFAVRLASRGTALLVSTWRTNVSETGPTVSACLAPAPAGSDTPVQLSQAACGAADSLPVTWTYDFVSGPPAPGTVQWASYESSPGSCLTARPNSSDVAIAPCCRGANCTESNRQLQLWAQPLPGISPYPVLMSRYPGKEMCLTRVCTAA